MNTDTKITKIINLKLWNDMENALSEYMKVFVSKSKTLDYDEKQRIADINYATAMKKFKELEI